MGLKAQAVQVDMYDMFCCLQGVLKTKTPKTPYQMTFLEVLLLFFLIFFSLDLTDFYEDM